MSYLGIDTDHNSSSQHHKGVAHVVSVFVWRQLDGSTTTQLLPSLGGLLQSMPGPQFSWTFPPHWQLIGFLFSGCKMVQKTPLGVWTRFHYPEHGL